MSIKIVIATHKEYIMPNAEYYQPVFAGSALKNNVLPYQRDDDGDNISHKNKSYCELTTLYWAYKNLEADYIGLCHYRRYFDLDGICLQKNNVIVPKKRHYYIETVYSQFKHAHGSIGLDVARNVLKDKYPEYLVSFDSRMNKRSLHLYNMFIMKYDIFIKYCDFLFTVLFEIEKQLGEVDRLYGYIGERMLDVFLYKNKIVYKEVNIINTESVNWFEKIISFIIRKLKLSSYKDKC